MWCNEMQREKDKGFVMKEKEKGLYWTLGLSIGIVLLCLGLIIYFVVRELTGGLPGSGLTIGASMVPCLGLILLQILIYIYALYCKKKDMKESIKMCNSTCIFGILISGYMLTISVIFLYTKFEHFSYFLSVLILTILNMAFLMWYKARVGKLL